MLSKKSANNASDVKFKFNDDSDMEDDNYF